MNPISAYCQWRRRKAKQYLWNLARFKRRQMSDALRESIVMEDKEINCGASYLFGKHYIWKRLPNTGRLIAIDSVVLSASARRKLQVLSDKRSK